MHDQIAAGPGTSSPLYKSSNYVSQKMLEEKREKGRASSFVILTSCFSSHTCRQNTDEGEIQGRLHRSPEAGAGEGVSFQQIHHHQEEI